MIKQTCKAFLLGCVLVGISGADWLHPRTRPCFKTGIPIRDYQYKGRSRVLIAVSKKAVLKTEFSQANVIKQQIKVFQFDLAKFQIDLCFLSRIACTIQPNGRWHLTLRADQNPGVRLEGSQPPFQPQSGSFTDFLKRNQFVVKVRCLGFFPEDVKELIVTTGKPSLVELPEQRFWVQRAEPYILATQGYLPGLQGYFNQIDRIEIEFYYYK